MCESRKKSAKFTDVGKLASRHLIHDPGGFTAFGFTQYHPPTPINNFRHMRPSRNQKMSVSTRAAHGQIIADHAGAM